MTTNLTTTNDTPYIVDWLPINPDLEPIEGWQLINEEVDGQHSYLIEYYKACRSGKEIIGRDLITTLEGLMQDILYRKDKYRFDIKPAHKRINFIEKEIKHFEAPFAGKPFRLALCQKAIAESIFGFYIFDEELLGGARWVRRFKEVLLLMARKNGKTPFVAALTLAEFVCGEVGQKVMCASNDYTQAELVYDCINNFREESKALSKVTRKNQKGIFWGNPKQKKKSGKFSKQNKGNIKKFSAKSTTKEGRNLKIVIVDEVHEMKDSSTVTPLRSSQTTQDEPLYFEITTEGIVYDGYLDERLADARKIISGEKQDDRWLCWLYTQDSEAEVYADERTWKKSNPLLGVVKKIGDLRRLLEQARTHATKRALILAKEFNIKYATPGAWLNDKEIENVATFELKDFTKCWCICGVDLAETNDLCACSFIFMRPNDDTKYIHTMYFVTEAKTGNAFSTESPTNPEKKDYKQWAKEGLVRIVKGNVIDDDVVAKYILEIWETYNIRPYRVGYDQWHAKEFAKIISKSFGADVPVKIKMSYEVLDVPMQTLAADMQSKYVNYNDNAICKWNFRNTAVKNNKEGLAMPTKINGYIGNKIDGTVSKIIGYATMRECKDAFMWRIGDGR